MDKVLIYYENIKFFDQIKVELQKYRGQFTAIYTHNKSEAIENIATNKIRVFISEYSLDMPDKEDLIKILIQKKQQILCIQLIEKKIKNIKIEKHIYLYIEKKSAKEELAEVIIQALDHLDEGKTWSRK